MTTRELLITVTLLSLSACTSAPTVYGGGSGSTVYITDQQVEVADCKPIGNVRLADEHDRTGYGKDNQLELRLRVARLGGNTGLVISGTLDRPLEGVAFKCRAG